MTPPRILTVLSVFVILVGCSGDDGTDPRSAEEGAMTKEVLDRVMKVMMLEGCGPEAIEELLVHLRDPNPNVGAAAGHKLSAIGTPAVPGLVLALDEIDSPCRLPAIYALGRIGPAAAPARERLLELSLTDSEIRRLAIAETLTAIGSRDETEALILAGLLGSKSAETRNKAAKGLAKLGRAASPSLEALLAVLEDPDHTVRRLVWSAVAYGLDAVDAIPLPVLLAIMAPDSGNEPWYGMTTGTVVRSIAAQALGNRAKDAERVIPVLEKALRSGDIMSYPLIALALRDLGEPARALSGLRAALEQEKGSNGRMLLAAALGRLGTLPDAVATLATLLAEDSDPGVRVMALDALQQIGPKARAALPAIRRALDDESPDVRASAPVALVHWGEDPEAGLAALRRGLRDDSEDMRKGTAFAISRMAASAGPLIPDLIEGLSDDHPGVRDGCVWALCQIGPAASASAPALERLLEDPDPGVKYGAAAALSAVGASTPKSRGTVRLGLTNPEKEIRGICADGLGRGPGPEDESIESLVATLGDGEKEVRDAAATALVNIGETAIPALSRAVTHDLVLVRWGAVATIGRLGNRAASTVPNLAVALVDAHRCVRLEALRSLGQIGIAARGALPAIQVAQDDSVPEVAGAAKKLLTKLRDL
jgi:HEAT repeat protein